MKPITPQEAAKKASLPTAVLEVWNEMISSKFNGQSSTINQGDIVRALVERMSTSRKMVFDNGWLDVELLFRQAGWRVTYDKPGFDENYEAYFKFEVS